MISAFKQFVLKLINMLSLGIDVGEDIMYSAKDISTYSREGTQMFLKESRIERADAIAQIEQRIKEKNLDH